MTQLGDPTQNEVPYGYCAVAYDEHKEEDGTEHGQGIERGTHDDTAASSWDMVQRVGGLAQAEGNGSERKGGEPPTPHGKERRKGTTRERLGRTTARGPAGRIPPAVIDNLRRWRAFVGWSRILTDQDKGAQLGGRARAQKDEERAEENEEAGRSTVSTARTGGSSTGDKEENQPRTQRQLGARERFTLRETYVVGEFRLIIAMVGWAADLSTICGQFISRNGVKVTSMLNDNEEPRRPVANFVERHPDTFQTLGHGFITLTEYYLDPRFPGRPERRKKAKGRRGAAGGRPGRKRQDPVALLRMGDDREEGAARHYQITARTMREEQGGHARADDPWGLRWVRQHTGELRTMRAWPSEAGEATAELATKRILLPLSLRGHLRMGYLGPQFADIVDEVYSTDTIESGYLLTVTFVQAIAGTKLGPTRLVDLRIWGWLPMKRLTVMDEEREEAGMSFTYFLGQGQEEMVCIDTADGPVLDAVRWARPRKIYEIVEAMEAVPEMEEDEAAPEYMSLVVQRFARVQVGEDEDDVEE